MRKLALYRWFFTQIRQQTPRVQHRFQTRQMSPSIPPFRSPPESVVECPAFKKKRIEVNYQPDTRPWVETAVRTEVENPVQMDSSSVRRRRNRRRKERTHLATHRLHPMNPNHTVGQKSSNLDHVFAALSVRHFARQQGVDLSPLVPGSEKNGRITWSCCR